jgi:hypothetical protein
VQGEPDAQRRKSASRERNEPRKEPAQVEGSSQKQAAQAQLVADDDFLGPLFRENVSHGKGAVSLCCLALQRWVTAVSVGRPFS